MKKGIWFVLFFILVVTGLLSIYQRSNSVWEDGIIEIVDDSKVVALNDFLDYYNSGSFAKVKVINDVELQWYVFLEETEWLPMRVLKSKGIQHHYNVLETKKPMNVSVFDLWMTTSWWVILEVEYTEISMAQKVLEQVGPILLFLLVLIIFAKFIMPKWWGLPFNMKVGKQQTTAMSKTRFDDIAGMDEVKMELSEIVDYLKSPEKYKKVWARHPKWVLLYGQPWSGKTLLARAVAWESNVSFFSASGSEFMEMLVGMWAAKVRELFKKAKTAGTAIIFIDEIDAIGRKRWMWHTWWHQEQEQTLNQILTEMDGFDKTNNIVVIAATNRPDILDPALLRAGRFDRKVLVSSPTYDERILIFNYYLKDKNLDKTVNVESLSKRTSGLVGADIENIVNEAALRVAKNEREIFSMTDLDYALEKVLMWPEKKVKSISEEEKNIIAFHELWHAVTLHLCKHTDDVEKISIVRRGSALWATWTLPKEDKYLYSKAKFLDEIIWLLGWRAAEEIFFGKDAVTTWASNDFERATSIVKDMIIKYGMDDDLWVVLYFDKDKEDYPIYKPYSEKTAELIDQKVKMYLSQGYEQAKKIVKAQKSNIEKMSAVLLEKEYLNKEEFVSMMEDISKADFYLKEALLEHKKKLAAEKLVQKNKLKVKKKEAEKKDKVSIKKSAWLKDVLDKFLW